MDSPSYNLHNRTLGRIAKFTNESAAGKALEGAQREGSLAGSLTPLGTGVMNVVRDYPWTLSKRTGMELEEIPYIHLKEYKCVDSSIKKQLQFYYQLTKDKAQSVIQAVSLGTLSDGLNNGGTIDVYADIWPKDNPTKFEYRFPFFQKTGFDLTTDQWTNLESMGDSLKDIAEGGAKMINSKVAEKIAKGFGKVLDVLDAGTNAILNYSYPNVSVTDRPRIFSSHNERSVTINFTLYNTLGPNDWQNNRDLIYLLMSQNLFNKRDLTTGVPPVFYEVLIPGQYYSYASCVTNLKADYIGNQRLLYGEYIVPDAYEVSITLQEMVKPSKNQFEAIQSGEARNYVYVKTEASKESTNTINKTAEEAAARMGITPGSTGESTSTSRSPSPAAAGASFAGSPMRPRGGRIKTSSSIPPGSGGTVIG